MNKKHGGKREGAGRKPALYPVRTKKFRASPQEWQAFLLVCPDDAREAFELVFGLLKEYAARDLVEGKSE